MMRKQPYNSLLLCIGLSISLPGWSMSHSSPPTPEQKPLSSPNGRCIVIDPDSKKRLQPDTPPQACQQKAQTATEEPPPPQPVPLPEGGYLVPVQKKVP